MFKFTFDKSEAFRMAAEANQVTNASIKAAKDALAETARMAEVKAREIASQKLRGTRQKYEDALSYKRPSEDVHEIRLDKSASHLEEGYEAYDMIERGLARGPASKVGAGGHRYVIIPFEHSQAPAKVSHPENQRLVQIGQPGQTTRGNLAQDLKLLKQTFGVTQNTKGPSGPLQGKVWAMRKSDAGPQWSFKDALGRNQTTTFTGDRQPNPLLSGLTKYQTQVGGTMKSQYFTFRTASENPNRSAAWRHPGFKGVHAFEQLYAWVSTEIEKQLAEIWK